MSDRDTRIAIIGAGVAGLATAHYLKQNGYRNVTVLEELGRVGGLCRSLTSEGKSFDLGANYMTLSYREVRKIARKVGAKTYMGYPYCVAHVPEDADGRVTYDPFLRGILKNFDDPANPIRFSTFAWAILRFIRIRWRLRKLLDRPRFAGLAEHDRKASDDRDRLCVPFEKWLKNNDIACLRPLFEIPITMMGYGFLQLTATPYVLRFMTLGTFVPMVMRHVPVMKYFSLWPRRFVHGYQRFLEDLARDLDVRLGVDIHAVRRPGDASCPGLDKIAIDFEHPGQVLFDEEMRPKTLFFDRLILACPLVPSNLRFLELSPEEEHLFAQVKTVSYCMTTFHVEGLKMETPVCVVPPFNEETMGRPWAVVKMFPEASNLTQFYTWKNSALEADIQEEVIGRAKALLHQMDGAYVAGEDPAGPEPEKARWCTYDRWPYFQHVTDQDFSRGFYDDLEELQEAPNRTNYVGGPTNFELIEPIFEYAKDMVARQFPPAR